MTNTKETNTTYNVQAAGSGGIELVPSPSAQSLPVAACRFSGPLMTCPLASTLEEGTLYSVTVPASAVADAIMGKPAAADVVLSFTTISRDYVGPTIALPSGLASLMSSPSNPAAGSAQGVAGSTNLALAFTEVVQAGSGFVTLTDVSGNTPVQPTRGFRVRTSGTYFGYVYV